MFIQTIKNTNFTEVDKLIYNTFIHSKYGYRNESELVNKIRKSKNYVPELELVALNDSKQIIGYGLLSEVNIVKNCQNFVGLILAPLAVFSDNQGKEVGDILLTLLEYRAKKLGYNYISILDHTTYSPRFGYEPASKYQIKAPFKTLDNLFGI